MAANPEFDDTPIMMLLDLFENQGVDAFVDQTMHDLLSRLIAWGAVYCIVGHPEKANLGAMLTILAGDQTHWDFNEMAVASAKAWEERQNNE